MHSLLNLLLLLLHFPNLSILNFQLLLQHRNPRPKLLNLTLIQHPHRLHPHLLQHILPLILHHPNLILNPHPPQLSLLNTPCCQCWINILGVFHRPQNQIFL